MFECNNDILFLNLVEHGVSEPVECVYSGLGRILDSCSYTPADPDLLLGVDWADRGRTSVRAGYFVGMKWIEPGVSAMCVTPKIKGLDVLGMFMHCFRDDCPEMRAALGEIYRIDFDSPMIPASGGQVELTPFIVAHFLLLLEGIVRKGVMRNYIGRDASLQGKIKGKICVGTTLKRHHASSRFDKTYCRYHEFSTDCVENRVLNTALLFCERFLSGCHGMNNSDVLWEKANYCRGSFAGIGEVDPRASVPVLRINRLYPEYSEALRVASWIFRMFGCDFDNVLHGNKHMMPPFFINMPLLYELFVLSLLRDAYGKTIVYHPATFGNELDFVKTDEKLIIDTKYIPRWKTDTVHENVRQLSGYARHKKIRQRVLDDCERDSSIIDCVIIYPSDQGLKSFPGTVPLLELAETSEMYVSFYLLPVCLPVIGAGG